MNGDRDAALASATLYKRCSEARASEADDPPALAFGDVIMPMVGGSLSIGRV